MVPKENARTRQRYLLETNPVNRMKKIKIGTNELDIKQNYQLISFLSTKDMQTGMSPKVYYYLLTSRTDKTRNLKTMACSKRTMSRGEQSPSAMFFAMDGGKQVSTWKFKEKSSRSKNNNIRGTQRDGSRYQRQT